MSEADAEQRDRALYREYKVETWSGTLTGTAAWGMTEDEYVAQQREERRTRDAFLATAAEKAKKEGIPLEQLGVVGYVGSEEIHVFRIARAPMPLRPVMRPRGLRRTRPDRKVVGRRSARSQSRRTASSGRSPDDPAPGDDPPAPLAAAAGRADDSGAILRWWGRIRSGERRNSQHRTQAGAGIQRAAFRWQRDLIDEQRRASDPNGLEHVAAALGRWFQ